MTRSNVPLTVLITLVAVAVIALVVGYASVTSGLIPANADASPGKFERWAAHTSLNATLARETKGLHDPFPATDATVITGIRLYGENCAVCHGASDGAESAIGKGLYQQPPQFAKHGVSDDPVETTYWKIAHGIRLTGMPSFRKSLHEDQLWAIATFLRRMDSLSPAENRAWHALKNAAS